MPSVFFRDTDDYTEVKEELLYKLGLDPSTFTEENIKKDFKKRDRTPSPIKRLEDSLFINTGLNNMDTFSDYSFMQS